TTATDQKLIALAALGATPHADLIQETLNFGLTEDVRAQDLFRLFAYCGSNPKGRHVTWSFTKENWDLLPSKYAQTLSSMNLIIKYTTDFSCQKDHDDIKKFFDGRDTKSIDMALNQTLENVTISTKWVQRDSENVRKWLEASLI
ncbi:hypothetical protein CONCODRAFT_8146, partial [Conidiobolus coronatus NRRL 28638]